MPAPSTTRLVATIAKIRAASDKLEGRGESSPRLRWRRLHLVEFGRLAGGCLIMGVFSLSENR